MSAHLTFRRLLALAAVSALVAVVAAASPAAPGSVGPTFALSPTSGPAGTEVDVRGERFPVGFTARFRLDDATAGDVLAEGVAVTAQGTLATDFVIPVGTTPGDHVVHVCIRRQTAAETCDRMPRARFRVTAAPPPPTQPPTTPTTAGSFVVPTTQPAPDPTVTLSTTTSTPGELAGPTTSTTTGPIGVGQFAGPTTTHGTGLGSYAGDSSLPDLSVTGLEITQGIQNRDNDMPLVAARTTVLRVYVQTDDGDLPNVSAVLQLVRDGDHEVAVIEPDNGPITASETTPSRLDPDVSLNFTLPPDAIGATSQGDRLIATAFAFSTHPTTPALYEPTDVNNYEAEVFEFHPVGDLDVHLLNMHMHEQPLPTAPDATLGTQPEDIWALAATLTSLYRYHPVAGVNAVPGPMIYPPLHGLAFDWLPAAATEWDLTQDGVESSILAAVEAVWAETSSTDHLEQYYGIYREDLPREWGGFSNGTVAYGYVDLSFGANDPWYHRGGWLMAHELGHSIGFAHVGCKGTEGNPGSYPWSDPCLLAPVDADGYYGWDIRHDSFAVTDGPAVIGQTPGINPDSGYPYMGYQSSKWTDPWHYCRALVKFGVNCTAVAIPENEVGPTDGPDLAASSAPYQEIEGQVGWLRIGAIVAEADAQLLDASTIVEPLPHVLDEMARRRSTGRPTGVTAVLVDANGNVLSELPLVTTMEGADPTGGGDDSGDSDDSDISPDEVEPAVAGTVDYLRWLPGAAALQLRVDGQVVDERAVSANAPSITVLAPTGGTLAGPIEIVWEAADADGDQLAFDIAYSPDGGRTWKALAQLVAGPRYVVDDLAGLAGGDQAIFRVTARDGIHATAATSAPAVLPDQPPSVTILSPGEGATVPLHRAVTLLASTWDAEDAGDGVTVTWSSDRDGPLGTGDQLVTRTLSAGDHVVTATATDSQGGVTAASMSITVDPATALSRLDEAGFSAALAALSSGPRSQDGTGGSGGQPLVWGAAAVAVLAVLAAGVAVHRGRKREVTEPVA